MVLMSSGVLCRSIARLIGRIITPKDLEHPYFFCVILHLRASERGELLFQRCGAYENEERERALSAHCLSFHSLSFFPLPSAHSEHSDYRGPQQLDKWSYWMCSMTDMLIKGQTGRIMETASQKEWGEILVLQYFSVVWGFVCRILWLDMKLKLDERCIPVNLLPSHTSLKTTHHVEFVLGFRVIWGQRCPIVAAGLCLPIGPITQLSPLMTRKPGTTPASDWASVAWQTVLPSSVCPSLRAAFSDSRCLGENHHDDYCRRRRAALSLSSRLSFLLTNSRGFLCLGGGRALNEVWSERNGLRSRSSLPTHTRRREESTYNKH